MAAAAAALAPELAAALMPDEPASAYLARSAPLPVRTGLWFAPALRPGQAAEFVGASGSGKTALLVQAAADALSRGEPVLMIDADATFDVERLAAALRARFGHLRGGRGGGEEQPGGGEEPGGGGAAGEEQGEPLVAAALSRFGLLSCHSALELLSALVTLRASIERLESSSGNRRVRLVLLDNAAAFYWPLRAAAAAGAARPGKGGRAPPSSSSSSSFSSSSSPPQLLNLSTMAAASASALRRALKGSGAAALVTRHAVFPPSSSPFGGGERRGGGGGNQGDFFPASWLSLASRRADLAPAGPSSADVARAPRVRLTWHASAAEAARRRAAQAAAGGAGGDTAPPPLPPPSLLFDLTDAGLVPL